MIKWIRVTVILAISACVWVFIAWILAEGLIVEKPIEKADAILILAGSSTFRERTETGAMLFRLGIARQILLTDDGERAGWSQTEQRNPPFVELAKRNLVEQGVPESDVEILGGIVDGTNSEAEMLAGIAENRKLNSVALVTSAYHTRRALATFENTFAEKKLSVQFGIFHAPVGIQTPDAKTWWLYADGWRFVVGEYAKILYHSISFGTLWKQS
jgi:uncharacterized SAM-binding protein YcdF (DUF218 family)